MGGTASRRVRAHVEGVVQGVYFRASTCEAARRLGLAGWVRNLPDGRVEVLAEGPSPDVQALLGWLDHGPPGARVDRVVLREEPPAGETGPFDVRPTPR